VIGVDVGATTMSAGLVTDEGEVLSVTQAPTRPDAITAPVVFEAAALGDPVAAEIVERACRRRVPPEERSGHGPTGT
jgi:hypothetical protein